MTFGVFIFLAALAVISALGVVIQRNPVHSLLALVFTLLIIAVLFIGLGAVTVGILQAIVYAGAIMVLFLFVIWLLNIQAQPLDTGHLALKLFGSIAVAALVAELFGFVVNFRHPVVPAAPSADYGSVSSLADLLFENYLIAFEVTSILLLAAVVGSIALARRPSPTVKTDAQTRTSPGAA